MKLNNGFEIPQIGVGFLRQSLLILLLCGVCFACNAPQQDGKKTDLTNENKNMTNGELRESRTNLFALSSVRTNGRRPKGKAFFARSAKRNYY